MRVRAILITATLAAMTSAAPVPKEWAKRGEKDKQLIIGEWRDDMLGAKVWFATEVGLTWLFGGPKGSQYFYTLKPAAQPKTIDLLGFGDKEPKHGIYRLDGDTLTICLNETPGGARPTDFEAGGKEDAILLTLIRVKDGDKDK